MDETLAVAALVLLAGTALPQAENVPAGHPVYTFLKRMSVKGLIERYSETVIPLGRREVAGFLAATEVRRAELSEAEAAWLDDYLSEFHYDLTGDTRGYHRLIDPEDGLPVVSQVVPQEKAFNGPYAEWGADLVVAISPSVLWSGLCWAVAPDRRPRRASAWWLSPRPGNHSRPES